MADFTNIDGVYAKDTELRSGIDTLRTTVLSNTIKPLTVTKNDTYTAIPSSGTYGYSPIIVDVQEEPWTPLQDGYSNFWFELTNDTLSPWLNFSAKTNNATIDWGDGSGEVALDTLTPTHTYSKAGRYVVKVKGVTGIARTSATSSPAMYDYSDVLKNIELASEVTAIASYAYMFCLGLEHFISHNLTGITLGRECFSRACTLKSVKLKTGSIPISIFGYCFSLMSVDISGETNIDTSAFYMCYNLREIKIPSTVTEINGSVFTNCHSLGVIHCQATTPPTLGTNVFNGLPSNWICYVPVGTGDTYKAAEGWSTYADHIVEEGQSLSKSQLRAIAEEQKKSDNGEEMR